jgi:hypothetical protein
VRGPTATLGTAADVEGRVVSGGVAPRHCVLTAYEAGKATVAAVGTNQVRMGPHANVPWASIGPVGTAWLSTGCVIYLGPPGRGVLVEFLGCQALGVGSHGAVQSAHSLRVTDVVSPSRRWGPLLGCLGTLAASLSAGICLAGAWPLLVQEPIPIGPHGAEYEFIDYVDPATAGVSAEMLEGVHRPYWDFVMRHNVDALGNPPGMDRPEAWDETFVEYVAASMRGHGSQWPFYRRLDAVKKEYATVVLMLRDAGLPDVFAAMPYRESLYTGHMQSEYCARGYWQFMPETAFRLSTKNGIELQVRDCSLVGMGDYLYTPSKLAPPRRVADAPYWRDGSCLIKGCQVDDREDLRKSTRAAVFELQTTMNDPLLKGSGSVVQIAIAAHNAGYWDGRFGDEFHKPSNLRPTYERWSENFPKDGVSFYGDNVLCATDKDAGYCGGVLPAQTQHYVYSIVARQFLAACYYGLNYGNERAFKPYQKYTGADGYCAAFGVPTKAQVQAH